VDQPGRGAHVGVGEAGDVLLQEVEQPALPLEQPEQEQGGGVPFFRRERVGGGGRALRRLDRWERRSRDRPPKRMESASLSREKNDMARQ